MVMKVNEKFEKTRNVENNDNSKNYILRREGITTYYDRFLSKSKEKQQKSYFSLACFRIF